MKCFKLTIVSLVVAQLSVALFVPESSGLVARQNNRFGGGGRGGQNGGGNNGGGDAGDNDGGNQDGNDGGNQDGNDGGNQDGNDGGNQDGNDGGNGGGDAGDADPATSLTLDPSVIQTINGQGQAAGEADSLLSTNNFIGFCVGKTITNGKQVDTGSCNPTPMGDIPSVDNMPSVKFEFPPNGGDVQPDTPFTIVMNIRGMQTGAFTNAANTYYAAPQQLNNAGQIIGHNHVVVEEIASLDSTQPTNPRVFAFFKGLNAAAAGGQLTADVTKGLPAGTYRMSSITSAANHQSVVMPIAQRGSVDDAVYFTVGGNGNAGGGNGDGDAGDNVVDAGNGNDNDNVDAGNDNVDADNGNDNVDDAGNGNDNVDDAGNGNDNVDDAGNGNDDAGNGAGNGDGGADNRRRNVVRRYERRFFRRD